MKRLTLLLTCFFISMGFAIAQNNQISGIVVDEIGEPVIGASVVVKGNALIGVSTDIEGRFRLDVPSSAQKLIVRYLGMLEQEVAVAPSVFVTLYSSSNELDELIVVAYGTTKKSSFTGSAEVIKNEAIERRSVANLSKAIEGIVPGVQSTSGGGQPGAEASIRIRGIGSINASSTPLYVVDGAPYDGDINALNPNDIESISVLKDASASALYGARGANGVIMVTTKKGAAGKTNINLKASWGITSRAIADYQTVNSAQYMELAFEALRNQYVYRANMPVNEANAAALANYMGVLGGEMYNPYNIVSTSLIDPATGKINPAAQLKYRDNWLKEAEAENPLRQEYLLSLSGGSEQHKYLISLGYLDEAGLLKNSSFERFSGRLNLDSKFTNWLNGGMNTSFSQTKQNTIYGRDSSASNVWYTALTMSPIYPIYLRDQNGDYILEAGKKQFDYGETRPYTGDFNTIATLYDDKQGRNADNFSTRVFAEIGDKKNEDLGFFKDFKFQVNFSTDYRSLNEMLYWNPTMGNAKNYSGFLHKENTRLLSYTFNQLLFYQKNFGLHNLDILAGHESFSREKAYLGAARRTFPFSGLHELNTGATLDAADSYSDRYFVESYLSRINYDFNNKYYLSGSFRSDASSRFHKDNRWGQFWSLGAAWRISEEDFMESVSGVNNLTLKVSYGQQGNDYLQYLDGGVYYETYYAWQSLYDLTYPNASLSGAILKSLENKDLKWEKNNNFNVGFEGRFLDNRLWATVEYFNRKTQDMLLEKTMANSTGFDGFSANVGDMVNKGFDLTIGGNIFRQNAFEWNLTFVGTHFKNEVTKLNYDGQELIDGARIITVGQPINSWYLPKSAGVDPLTGMQLYWYADDKGEMQITDSYAKGTASRFIQGSRVPDFYGSITNDFRIGSFDVSFLTTFSLGGKEYDSVYSNLMGMRDAGSNWHKDMERRWQNVGDITDVPRLMLGNVDAPSDRYLVDASYFAIKNVTVGYTLSRKLLNKIGMSQIRVFAVGDNLSTFTHLKGLDPQNSVYGGQSYSYVPVRNISLGIDIKF